MGNFKLGIFEIFAGVIPGLPILVIFYSLNNGIHLFSVNWGLIISNNFLFSGIMILAIISYLIGFTLQYPAYEIFKLIFNNLKLWEKRKCGKKISLAKRGKEIAQIRLKSPESYSILNIFMGLRTMCYTLFFSLIIFNLVFIFQLICYKVFNFEIIAKFSLLILANVIILRRAISFHEWSQKLITNTMSVLNAAADHKYEL